MNIRVVLLSLSLMLLMPSFSYAGQLYVVVSNNLRGESFSQADIKRILLGEISMVKNARITLIYPSYTSKEIEALSKFVGKGGSVRNLKAYWSKIIFTGKGTPPVTANSEEELKQLINKENAIGVSTVSTGLNVVYTITE